MVKGLNVKITVRDNVTGEYLKIPVIPAKLEYKDGNAMTDTVKILNKGNVDFFSGVDLDSIGWSSFFPARHDPGYVKIAESELQDPLEYREKFRSWKNTGRSLQLIIPVLDINVNMYVASFIWDLHGFEKDIYYTVNFRQYKTIRPRKYNTNTGVIEEPDRVTMADRPPVPEKELPNPYKVKSGDTLTLIAKRYGTDWRRIYEANKSIIGPDPDIIQPGQELYIV